MSGLEKFVDLDVEKLILKYVVSFQTIDNFDNCMYELLHEYQYYLLGKYDRSDLDIKFTTPPYSKKNMFKRSLICGINNYFHDSDTDTDNSDSDSNSNSDSESESFTSFNSDHVYFDFPTFV